jgi:hypothetical protein
MELNGSSSPAEKWSAPEKTTKWGKEMDEKQVSLTFKTSESIKRIGSEEDDGRKSGH